MPEWELIQWSPALDSSDFTPTEWVRLAHDIGKHYYEFDGFVVLHGTDTMAYSASALSFMLEGLSKPVIFTGAQVPLGAIYNDAKRNLIVSILLAANFDIPEVCIFFNLKLYRGNRTKKVDSWCVLAFGLQCVLLLFFLSSALSFINDARFASVTRHTFFSTYVCYCARRRAQGHRRVPESEFPAARHAWHGGEFAHQFIVRGAQAALPRRRPAVHQYLCAANDSRF